MTDNDIFDFLSLVNKPSQYIGSEVNSVKKDLNAIDLHIALAFPDLYEIGTSHFGLQILYHILNQEKYIAAERVFAPQVDMAQRLRQQRMALASLETQTPIGRFDIVGFSLLYELNYTNVLLMMDLANIPFFAHQRDDTYPIIIAGGPCTCNPEPVADFFDAMVIGDGEDVILQMCTVYRDWKSRPSRTKSELLKSWSEISGVYVPSFFKTVRSIDGFQTTIPCDATVEKVSRAIVPDLDRTPFPDVPIVPWGKPIHDRLRLEISRGCTRGCRFCQAGMIYRPVRERSLENLLALAEKALKSTGYEDLSLLSLSTGDHSCLVPLMEQLMSETNRHPTAVSLPSIRADALTPTLMKLIKTVRKTGFTIAPEAGTQRLRDVINKNISEADIVKTVSDALSLGWQGIKLYFMVGLPTETQEDLEGIVDLVKKLLQVKGQTHRPAQLSVSVATFIPKPHTPFQWASQARLEASEAKIKWLKDHLRLSRVRVKWQNPETSLLEGLWARGGRELSNLLVKAYEKGCLFDGWSDQFQFDLWQAALRETNVDIDFYTTRERVTEEPLPWDHIDIGVTKKYLMNEWQTAVEGKSTPDCRWGECTGCGVCDHNEIAPKIYGKNKYPAFDPPNMESLSSDYKKIHLVFSKTGPSRFLGHLELVNTIMRALRRSDIAIKYTEGFHPKPKMSFQDALPVGLQSLKESMVLTVHASQHPKFIFETLSPLMSDGLTLLSVEEIKGKNDINNRISPKTTYSVILKDGFFDQKDLKYFQNNHEFLMTRVNKKGKQKIINQKDFVTELILVSPKEITLTLQSQNQATLRPADVLREIFHLPEDQVKLADITKL